MARVYSPDHPLRSAQLKIQRAKVHIDGLQRRTKRFVATNPRPTIITEEQFRTGYQPFDKPSSLPPQTWGPILGDIVGDLRDALDHIAWQLARKRFARGDLDPKKERKIYFPLAASPTAFASHEALSYIWKDAHCVLEKFQPYKADEWPDVAMLGVLDQFASFDKHRLLAIGFTGGRVMNVPPGHRIAFPPGDERRALVVQAVFTPQPISDSVPNIAPNVFFVAAEKAVGAPSGHSIEYFAAVHRFIRDEVFPAFEGFFK